MYLNDVTARDREAKEHITGAAASIMPATDAKKLCLTDLVLILESLFHGAYAIGLRDGKHQRGDDNDN